MSERLFFGMVPEGISAEPMGVVLFEQLITRLLLCFNKPWGCFARLFLVTPYLYPFLGVFIPVFALCLSGGF